MFFRAKCRKCKRACEWKVLASTLLKTSSCLFCLNFGRGARWQCLKVVITFRSTQKCVFEVLWMVTVYSPELVLDVFCWLSGENKKIRVVTFYLWLKWAIMQQVNFLSAHCTQLSPPHAITLTIPKGPDPWQSQIFPKLTRPTHFVSRQPVTFLTCLCSLRIRPEIHEC